MRMIRNIEEGRGAGADCDGCEEVRCGCGSLLARVVEDEVELKCRRCKRVWRVALEGAGGHGARRGAAAAAGGSRP